MRYNDLSRGQSPISNEQIRIKNKAGYLLSYPFDQLLHTITLSLHLQRGRLHKGVLHMLAMDLLFVITIEHMFDVGGKVRV